MLSDEVKIQLELPFLSDSDFSDSDLSDSETLSWPPNYTIRLSARSKRVTLSISPRKGLEVIIPNRLRRHPNILNLLNEKRPWIEKNLKPILAKKQKKLSEISLPHLLDLRAIHKMIHLSYESTQFKSIKIKPLSGVSDSYRVYGPIEQHAAVFIALKFFIKSLAKIYLIPWISKLSDETGLQYSGITIRSQSTLWGSCTRARKISLNNKLLFLPDYLARYILVHELCHIQHLNHSKRFWNLVQKHDPSYDLHRKLMKKAGEYVPSWLEFEEN